MGVLQEGRMQELHKEGDEASSDWRLGWAHMGQPEAAGVCRGGDFSFACVGAKLAHVISPLKMTHAHAQLVCAFYITLYYVWWAGGGSSGDDCMCVLCCTASPVFFFLRCCC